MPENEENEPDEELPESPETLIEKIDGLSEREVRRALVRYDLEELTSTLPVLEEKEQRELLSDVIDAKIEAMKYENKREVLEAQRESRERREATEEPYLSDKQVQKVEEPAKRYAKKCWQSGVWNVAWGSPEFYDIKIKPRVIRNTRNPNRDFVYMAYSVLGIEWSDAWGSKEEYMGVE